MKLKIKKDAPLKNMQEQFNAVYPYLKNEFFRKANSENELSPADEKIDPGTVAGRLPDFKKEGTINIGGQRTVAQMETDFREIAGLFVQVFRKAGSLWIGTSRTDGWTLRKQNEEGRVSGRPANGRTFSEKLADRHIDAD